MKDALEPARAVSPEVRVAARRASRIGAAAFQEMADEP